VCLFFLVAGLVPALYRVTPVPLVRPLDSLPLRLGSWTAAGAPEGEARWWAGADDLLARRYSNGAAAADVWIGYFASQRQGKELVSHRIDALHRASIGAGTRTDGAPAEVNALRLTDHGQDRMGVFWYEIDGRRVTGKLQAKWLTLWNSALRRRSNGTVIVIMFGGSGAGAGDRGLAEAMALGDLVHEALAKLEPGA
jgi:EpsI family protein